MNDATKPAWLGHRFLLAPFVFAAAALVCGQADSRPRCHRPLRRIERQAVCPAVRPDARQPNLEQAALEHPGEPRPEELAWFRAHPEARARLLARLAQPGIDDNDPARLLLWSLLKEQVLMPSEAAQVLDQAFHLIPLRTGGSTWWVFDRRHGARVRLHHAADLRLP